MGHVKLVTKLSKMGDKIIIIIPKDFHEDVNALKGTQVRVTLDDEF